MTRDLCAKEAWRRKLAAYVDGELRDADLAAVRAHLGACARCRGMVALDLRIAGLIREMPTHEAPASLTTAVLGRTVGAPPSPYRRIARWLPALRIAVPSGLVAAFLVLCKAAGFFHVAVSVSSIMMSAMIRDLAGAAATLSVAFRPIAKVAEFGRVWRELGSLLRDLLAGSQAGIALIAVALMLVLILIGALFIARRVPKGVGHAALV